MMKKVMRRLGLLLTIALPFLLPAAALAQEETASDGTGAAVTLSLIGLILVIIFVVAIVGAVGLGVIGIGYSITQSDEG